MGDVKRRSGRIVWCLLSAAVACLAAGNVMAACVQTLPISPGAVPCYIKVQPIDVCLSDGTNCGAFNTTSSVGSPFNPDGTPSAGVPYQTLSNSNFPTGTMIPNNPASPNPIGFTVDPTTGTPNPASRNGVDITRVLMNDIGVELVWFPMEELDSNYSFGNNLTVTLTPTTTPVGTCTGSITGTTLTVTSCSSGGLAVYDALTWSGSPNPPTTFITAFGTGIGGAGTYTVSKSQTLSSKTITAKFTDLDSPNFKTLSNQPNISNGGTPSPVPPLSSDPSTVNMFFVSALTPPFSGGTLYGFSWLGNNGVAIGGNTFFAPTPLQARPDTIAHELLHNLNLDHTVYGAGPYNPQSSINPFPPGGFLPPVPAKPLPLECDPAYPACAANVMTAGNLRTVPGIVQPVQKGPIYNCALSGFMGEPVPTVCLGQASLFNGLADQVAVNVTSGASLGPCFEPIPTPFWPCVSSVISPAMPATTTGAAPQLPTSQQMEVLNGKSGLLFVNNPTLQFSGLLDPIPHETTKAQLETGGSSTGQAVFDVSSPIGGKPGETLVAWILTLPEGQTFARGGGFHVISQSRRDLVQDVKYYPDAGNNPLKRNIAYQPGADNNADNPGIEAAGPSPCASAMTECLVVEFQPPGLGANDSISFSKGILSGGAPITNEELCKAKITYVFSDGFVTTSNFGRCPAASLPLVASSWHPDPHVAPQFIKTNKSNLLLAQAPPTGGLIGYAYLNNCASTSAVVGFQQLLCPDGITHQPLNLTPDVTFSVPAPINPACSTGPYPGSTLCFSTSDSTQTTLKDFLTAGGATIITGTAAALNSLVNNTVLEFTGTVTVTTSSTPPVQVVPVSVVHDDGLQFEIGNSLVISSPGPTAPETTPGSYSGPSGTFIFDLVYGETNGGPAVLDVSLPLSANLPCTPDRFGHCPPLGTVADIDFLKEGAQCLQTNAAGQCISAQSCDNGKSFGNSTSGIIRGNVTVKANQSCSYGSPTTTCEITGGMVVNGGTVYLDCQLDGNLTVNSGTITLGESAHVIGNVQISQSAGSNFPSGFSIGSSAGRAEIDGGLTIKNIPASPNNTGGSVCNTLIKGGVSVLNTYSPTAIEIGDPNSADNCQGNTINGNLTCKNNSPSPPTNSNTFPNGGHNNCNS
jgi:hypothetical protein